MYGARAGKTSNDLLHKKTKALLKIAVYGGASLEAVLYVDGGRETV